MKVDTGGVYYYSPPVAVGSGQEALIGTSGSEQAGDRPFVIVSRASYNKGHTTAVGVPLSTKVNKANAFRILIPASELISDNSSVPFVDSVALCDHVRVLDLNQVRRRAGRVTENALRSIGLGLAYILDIR